MKSRIVSLLVPVFVIAMVYPQSGYAKYSLCEQLATFTDVARFNHLTSGWTVQDVKSGSQNAILAAIFDSGSKSVVRGAILPLIRKSPEMREALDEWLDKEFARQSFEIESRKTISVQEVLIGAGPHTLAYILAQKEKVSRIVLERSTVGSTFHRRAFHMNTDEAYQLNDIPGATFQTRDFLPSKGAPLANDFGFIVRLNYRAAGIKVLQNSSYLPGSLQVVDRWSRTLKFEVLNRVSQKLLTVHPHRIGIGVGLDAPDLSYFGNSAPAIQNLINMSEPAQTFDGTFGLMTGGQFLRLAFNPNNKIPPGLRIAVVGGKHTSFTAIEALYKKLSPGSSVHVFGMPFQDFDSRVTPPAGSAQFKQMIRDRYRSQGLLEALQSDSVHTYRDVVTKLIALPDGQFELSLKDGSRSTFDWVVLCTGADRKSGLWSIMVSDLNQNIGPTVESPIYDPENSSVIGREAVSSFGAMVYAYGPAADLPLDPSVRDRGPVGNPDALYVTLPRTALLGSLHERSRQRRASRPRWE